MTTYLEIKEQIKNLQIQAEKIKKEELVNVISEINQKIKLYGIKKDDLTFPEAIDIEQPVNEIKTRNKLTAKYKNTITDEEWSGRGQQPKWLKKAITEGHKLEDFLINKTPESIKNNTETTLLDINELNAI